MAFTDWNRFDNAGDTDITAETLLPIIGTQSIRFQKTVGGGNFNRRCNATPKDTSPLTNGINAGRLRNILCEHRSTNEYRHVCIYMLHAE